ASSCSSLNGLNPERDFTVNYNSFAPGPNVTNGFTFFTVTNAATHQVVFQDSFQNPSSTEAIIAAHTLSPHTQYNFELDFSNRLVVGSTTQGFDMRTDGSFTDPGWQFPVPSPVLDCPALSWRAVVFSAGGDGGRRSPEGQPLVLVVGGFYPLLFKPHPGGCRLYCLVVCWVVGAVSNPRR